MENLLHSNPWRPTDAWWQRASGILSEHHPPATVQRDSARGADWINRALRFQHASAAIRSPSMKLEVIARFSAIYYALQIFDPDVPNESTLRCRIESRILARQTNEDIAREHGCQPEDIEAFESLFFNVRDRLDHRDFILSQAVGSGSVAASERAPAQDSWKFFGYLAGPHVLDALMSCVPNGTVATNPDSVAAFFKDFTLNGILQKAATATLADFGNDKTPMKVIELLLKYLKIERTNDLQNAGDGPLQRWVQTLLESLPFEAVGIAEIKNLPDSDKCAAELRTDELIQAAVGSEVPDMDAWQQFGFPEPSPKS